ncbi:Class III chitinase [Penicillium diatomitis]|uniref:chitinase n=1 Tax=Penicillium diatomitis TaxID=2819901 RepID=A0A9W9XLI2_9EURO|nr:Class III chitinase [Penicillium diatomitis]KAJ5495246.1 Class III chitinase [Penicillium diatomitis]
MHGRRKYLFGSVLLASLRSVEAKLDLNSAKNIAVYWGQNSLQGNGGQVQQPLGYYCDNKDIDVIPLAFDMMINGPGGAPEVDFSVTSQDCDVFPGTQLKNCSKIGDDITTCQQKGKTILLSIGGATYSEGGFKSEADAKAGAKLMWETFGPTRAGSDALRPFGNATLDGFDFDFEATVTHMATFATELRTLMDQDTSKKYFLTAAPQCPYPDQADKDILNGPVSIDAVFVQFYNNFCGVNNFNADSTSSQYNFETWDNWAKTVSQNKKVKVLLGVPADTTAASTGYVPAAKLAEIIEYTKKFESFGGVMMWDMTQGYANTGFIESARKALGGPDSGSSSSSAASAATSAPSSTTPSSTNTSETSQSSNTPASASSSSSSSGSASSSNGPEPTNTTTNPPPPPQPEAAPMSTAAPNTADAPASPMSTSTSSSEKAPTSAETKASLSDLSSPVATSSKTKVTTSVSFLPNATSSETKASISDLPSPAVASSTTKSSTFTPSLSGVASSETKASISEPSPPVVASSATKNSASISSSPVDTSSETQTSVSKASPTVVASATTKASTPTSSSATSTSSETKPTNDTSEYNNGSNAPADGSDPVPSDQATNGTEEGTGKASPSKGSLNLVGQDLLGLLQGLRQANTVTSRLKNNLRKASVLRHARRHAF